MATIYVITLEHAIYKQGDAANVNRDNISAFTTITSARKHLYKLGEKHLPLLNKRLYYENDKLSIHDDWTDENNDKMREFWVYKISEMSLKEDK